MSVSLTAARRARLFAAAHELTADALLVTNLINVRYLTGFTGSNGALLLTPQRAVFFTDPRYDEQAHQQTDCRVIIAKTGLLPLIAATIKRNRLRTVAVENLHLLYAEHQLLTEALENAATLLSLDARLDDLRLIKDETEITAIRQSVLTNSRAFARTLKRIKPGQTEIDIAAELEYQMRKLGAEKAAFDTIVAAGPHSALPHARPSDSPVTANQLLLIDMGAMQGGYASDMTRMAYLGRPTRQVRQNYAAVLEAQLAAIDRIKPGVTAGAVDQAARSVLRQHGLAKAFVHSTGHGLGLEIHEAPRLGRQQATKLQAGMVITIEPGVYIPGWGGIRIEDTVLVTAQGADILTPTTKELAVL